MNKEITNKTAGSEEKYRTLFNSIDEGFCIATAFYDHDGKIDVLINAINPAVKNILGIGDDIVGKTANAFFREIDEDRLSYWQRAAFDREVVHTESYFSYSDKFLEISWIPIGEKDSGEVAVLFKDITARKNAEQRQSYSLELTHVLQTAYSGENIQKAAAELLGKYLKSDRVMYA